MMGSLHQIVSGWAPTPWRAGACASSSLSTSPAVFPRAAGGFSPLSGGACSEGAEGATLGRQANAGQHMHLPSAATAFAPGCSPRCPGMAGGPDGKVRGRAALDICVTGTSRAHGQDRGNADGGRHATRRGKPGYAGDCGKVSSLRHAPSRGTKRPGTFTASTLAGSQPVAVDAAGILARKGEPLAQSEERARRLDGKGPAKGRTPKRPVYLTRILPHPAWCRIRRPAWARYRRQRQRAHASAAGNPRLLDCPDQTGRGRAPRSFSREGVMGVRREGNEIVIRMPVERAFALRVALDGMPPNAAEAAGSRDLRKSLSTAIAKAMAQKQGSQP